MIGFFNRFLDFLKFNNFSIHTDFDCFTGRTVADGIAPAFLLFRRFQDNIVFQPAELFQVIFILANFLLDVLERVFTQPMLFDAHSHIFLMAKLRNVYPNLMRLEYDNRRTQAASSLETVASTEKKTPSQLFGELFEMQNGQPMSEEQSKYVTNLFNEIWEVVANS